MRAFRLHPLAAALLLGASGTASAGVSFSSLTGVLTITGTAAADVASTTYNGRLVRATLNGASSDYSSVKQIVFHGGEGNDTFTNSTSIKSRIYGDGGDDKLNGGPGADYLEGGLGNDTLHGNAGTDVLYGSGGTDKLYGDDGDDDLRGHGGNDLLAGGTGNDALNGGSGNDTLQGGDGMDLIVAVGLGTDLISGGSQWDNFWVDTSDMINDVSTDESQKGYVHRIASFRPIMGTAVSLDANGEDLFDSAIEPGDAGSLVDYSSSPMFGPTGPLHTDIIQGSVGDCFFVSRLAAFAMVDPEFIRKSIAPLGDGSYAVRFWRSGVEDYVRVDADLWKNGDKLVYAKTPATNALWVPIWEKAFTVARQDAASYASINGGNGDELSVFWKNGATFGYTDGITEAQVRNWVNQGRPAGTVANAVAAGVKSYFNWVKSKQALNKPLVAGSFGTVANSAPFQSSNWRRASHIFAIRKVEFDINGNPLKLTLYNPYGADVEMTDLARIYYMISSARVLEQWAPTSS